MQHLYNTHSSMKAVTLFLVTLSLLVLSASAYTPTDAAVGTADCFNQKITAVLDGLGRAATYVCSVNTYTGPLPGDYDPFGPNFGIPFVQSQELSFYEIYYATPAGGYCAVARNTSDSTGQTLIGYFETDGAGYRVAYAVNLTNGALYGAPVQNITYDPTQRGWYQTIVATTGLSVTSTPYAFASTGLGITAGIQCNLGGSLSIVGAADALLAVLGTQSLTQDSCSQFDNSNSVAYVVNAQGILVLQNDYLITSVGYAFNTTSSALVAASATWAQGQSFTDGQVNAGQFTTSGTLYEYSSVPLSTVDSWDWTLVLVRPYTNSCSSSASRSVASWIF